MALALPRRIKDKKGDRRSKAVGNPSSVIHFHGSNGLFGSGAVDRDIISSIERPITGLAAVLPIVGTTTERIRFGTITGFTVSGSEAATPCDDGPTGAFAGCVMQNTMGLKIATTPSNNASKDRLRTDRADEDLQLQGMMLNNLEITGSMAEGDDILNSNIVGDMVGVMMQLEDYATYKVWQGDPTNDNVGGGYKEAKGFDLQIATGLTDINSVACPKMDSVVKSFGFSAPDEAGAGDYVGESLYDALRNMENTIYLRRLYRKALDMDMGVFMKPEAWQWVSEALPCQMEASTCGTELDGNKILYIDGDRNLRRTDEMRQLGAIRLNGRVYPVYEDSGLRTFNNTSNPGDLAVGEEASNIVFMPFTLRGFPVAYWRYNDYRLTSNEYVGEQLVNMWTDDGKIFWTIRQDGVCMNVTGRLELAPILRTPQFAGKLLYVRHA